MSSSFFCFSFPFVFSSSFIYLYLKDVARFVPVFLEMGLKVFVLNLEL